MEIPLMGTNLRFFGDTLENICDTQMCRDTQFENHWRREMKRTEQQLMYLNTERQKDRKTERQKKRHIQENIKNTENQI
jgi:hypothetical protein